MALVIFGVITLTFFAIRLVPGDPARLMEPPGTPESVLDLTRQKLGTDKPLSRQYLDFLSQLARGDMGTSFRGGRPVASTVLESVPNTLALGAISMAITTLVAFPLGIAASRKPNGWLDRATLALSSIAQATPGFWLGVMLALLFAVNLRWFPAIGNAGWKSYVLPVATLVISLFPLQIRAVRQAFIETMGEGFVRAARARGLSERRLLGVHITKVAAIPLITIIGLQAGYVLGGAIVIESIFNWPGIGNLTLQAISQRDFPMIQGTVLITAVVFTLINFFVDLTYAALDPRVRLR
ncbi:MAG: ABC transporter permease [Thermomicrobiales bacterium]|nr:ABC transporter permease [Thermomicrobiales bacterium]MCO5223026.1 ABC transporter permease [Thermomicrobiales bacterium]